MIIRMQFNIRKNVPLFKAIEDGMDKVERTKVQNLALPISSRENMAKLTQFSEAQFPRVNWV